MKSMVQQLTSGGLAKGHKAVAGAGDDDEEDGPTKGENPLLLQAVMSAASTAQEEEDEVPEEAEEFEDEEDYLSILTKDDDSDAMARTFSTLAEFGNASHPPASKVPRPPKRKIACPQYRANQPQLTHTPTQASLPHSQYRRSGSPTNSSLYSVSQAFSPPSEGSTNPVVVQVSPGQKSPVHRLPPATFPPAAGSGGLMHGRPLQRGLAAGHGGQWEEDFFQQQVDVRQDIRAMGSTLSDMSMVLQDMRQIPQVVNRLTHVLDRMDSSWKDMFKDLISIQREEGARHHAVA